MTVPSNLRFSVRRLARDWRFTMAATITLGLAIAANTVIFGAVYTVLLRPLPLESPDRLYVLWNGYPGAPGKAAISPPEFLDLRERLTAFERLAAFRDRTLTLSGVGAPLRLNALFVSPNLARALGVRPAAGRDFDPAEGDAPERVALLSHEFWQQTFGSDPAVVGRVVHLDGEAHRIVGVLPPELPFPAAASFHMPKRADIWIPGAWERLRGGSRGNQFLRVVARTRAGATRADIDQDLERVAAQFRREYPNRYSASIGWRLLAYPFREELVGASRPALTLLAGGAGLVLVMACANVANLMLGRGAARRREFGVKAALGASRFQIVQDFTSEALVLGAISGLLAAVLSTWALPVMAAAAPETLPHVSEARPDAVTLGFTVLLSLVVVILVGAGPALRVSSRDLQPALRENTAAVEQRVWRWLRTGLVVGEIALAFVVLTLAGLLLRTTVRLNREPLGFSPSGVISARISLPAYRYPQAEHQAAFFDQLLRALNDEPLVSAAALTDPVPLSGETWSGTFDIDGRETAPGEPMPHAEYSRISSGYFRAMQISLVVGRDFGGQDDSAAPEVVIVDETLAERYWPGKNAIGRRVKIGGPKAPPATVIGVVAHVRRDGPRQAGEPQIYVHYFQSRAEAMNVVVRAAADLDAGAVTAVLRRAVRDLDATLPLGTIVKLEDSNRRVLAVDRFNLALTAVFACCALILAAVGLYGVISYLITQRTRDMGIQIALGCTPATLSRRILAESGGWAILGIVAGVGIAVVIGRAVSSLLFEVSALDAATLATAGTVTFLIALVAAYVPARRIVAMDPVRALRAP